MARHYLSPVQSEIDKNRPQRWKDYGSHQVRAMLSPPLGQVSSGAYTRRPPLFYSDIVSEDWNRNRGASLPQGIPRLYTRQMSRDQQATTITKSARILYQVSVNNNSGFILENSFD